MTPSPPPSPSPAADWPRRLLAVLAQADPTALPSSALGWNLQPMRERAAPERRYRSGLHQHEYLEVCVVVRGRGMMEIEHCQYRMEYPSLVILPPGVLHSEGFDRRQHPYATVWICPGGEGQKVFANAYQPGQGWSCPWWATLPGRGRASLTRWFVKDHPLEPTAFELFRATLLAAVGELTRQTQARAGSGKKLAGTGHLRVLRWVQHYLDQHYAQPLTVKKVAALTRYSPHYLDALFAQWAGRGIRAYMIDRRMRQALWLCQHTDLPMREVAGRVGYADPFYFSRAFRRYHGRPPSQARNEQPET